MYPQKRVPEEDAEYQKLLCREGEKEEIIMYRLPSLTFGTACGPWVAQDA
jgi:hypothetical protein